MTFGQRRDLAQRLRTIPLEQVLPLCGARPDPDDHRKWHTPAGVLSVTGAKFMNWTLGAGGGGAIDLVIQLHHLDFKAAVNWLAGYFPGGLSTLRRSCYGGRAARSLGPLARLAATAPTTGARPTGARPRLPDRQPSPARGAVSTAHRLRHSLRRCPGQRRLPAAGPAQSTRRRRASRHHAAALARLGAGLPKRPGLLHHPRPPSAVPAPKDGPSLGPPPGLSTDRWWSFANRPSMPSVA